MPVNPWNKFELAPAGAATPSSKFAAVSRIPNSMEVWWIGANGSVQDAFWYEGAQWQRFELAPPGAASTNGGITAVSRIKNSMEVCWAGGDGSVQDSFWYDQVFQDTAIFDSGYLTSNLPLGGFVHLVMRRNGDFTFSCHAHDSGADNIDYVVSAVLMTPSGIAFTFQHSGSVEGTSAGLPFGSPNRNDDFITGGNNPAITNEFDGMAGAKLQPSINGKDTLVSGLTGMLSDLTKQVAEALGKAGAAAIVALVF
jgi:hypothetical protein